MGHQKGYMHLCMKELNIKYSQTRDSIKIHLLTRKRKNKNMYFIQTTDVYSQRNYTLVTNDPHRLLYLALKRTRC